MTKLAKEERAKILAELSQRITDMPDKEFLKKVKEYFIRQYETMPDASLQNQYRAVFKK
jgi:hypothetical protein